MDAVLSSIVTDVGAVRYETDDGIAKPLVGARIKSNRRRGLDMFDALAVEGVNIEMISTSSIRISCVIRSEDAERAMRAIVQPSSSRASARGGGRGDGRLPDAARSTTRTGRSARVRRLARGHGRGAAPRRAESERPPIGIKKPTPPSKTRPLLVLAALVGIAAGVSAFFAFRPDPCQGTNFESENFGYCLVVPDGWEAGPAQFGADGLTLDQFAPPTGSATVVVEAVDLETGTELEQWSTSSASATRTRVSRRVRERVRPRRHGRAAVGRLGLHQRTARP